MTTPGSPLPSPLHTSHPHCPEGTQRLLSNLSGQQSFGQTRQTVGEDLNLAGVAASDQSAVTGEVVGRFPPLPSGFYPNVCFPNKSKHSKKNKQKKQIKKPF